MSTNSASDFATEEEIKKIFDFFLEVNREVSNIGYCFISARNKESGYTDLLKSIQRSQKTIKETPESFSLLLKVRQVKKMTTVGEGCKKIIRIESDCWEKVKKLISRNELKNITSLIDERLSKLENILSPDSEKQEKKSVKKLEERDVENFRQILSEVKHLSQSAQYLLKSLMLISPK